MPLISTHTIVDEALFCIVSKQNTIRLWKWFESYRTTAKKELDVFEAFSVMTRVRMGENYISFPNSRELVDYTPTLFHLILWKYF